VHSACKLGERNNEVKLVVEMIKGLGGKKLGLSGKQKRCHNLPFIIIKIKIRLR
jgi:hypothetical protein